MKGIKLKISLDDTLIDVNSKISKAIGSDSFNLFEVCQDSKSKLCRVLRSNQDLF